MKLTAILGTALSMSLLLACNEPSENVRTRIKRTPTTIQGSDTDLPAADQNKHDTTLEQPDTSDPVVVQDFPRSLDKALNYLGYTVRADGDTPIEACSNGTVMPELSAFLSKLALHIMSRNPQTFAQNFSPERMCFNVVVNPEVNAVSVFNTGLITIYTGMISRFTDIRTLAFVISHELAHKTLSHENEYPLVAKNNADFMAAATEFKAVDAALLASENKWKDSCTKLAAQAPAFSGFPDINFQALQNSVAIPPVGGSLWFFECPTILGKVKPLVANPPQGTVFNNDVKTAVDNVTIDEQKNKDLIAQRASLELSLEAKFLSFYEFKGRSLFNWREIEADFAGYEFYRRAGFEALVGPFDFLPPEAAASCMYDIAARLPPDPGTARSHPSHCYRRYLIEKDELTTYKSLSNFPAEMTAVASWNQEFVAVKAKYGL